MNPTLEELKAKLEELEMIKNVSEFHFESEIRKLRKENDGEPCSQWVYEVMAFGFIENYVDEKSGWGTYFGPFAVWKKDDGTFTKSPSIQRVDKETLEYWLNRSEKSNNPIMKARYSNLVWDFSELIIRKKLTIQ